MSRVSGIDASSALGFFCRQKVRQEYTMSRLAHTFIGLLSIALTTIAGAQDSIPVSADRQLTRMQAHTAVENAQRDMRVAAISRLAEVGTMSDVDKLIDRLRDDDDNVRELAAAAMWNIWSRSGDDDIDALYKQGIQQMQAADLSDALTTFTEVVRRKPGFAEGWNKRATVLYMMGEHRKSLHDCDEALKRNPKHFGALSGMAQIHVLLGQPEKALEAYEKAIDINPNLPDAEENLKVLREAVYARRSKFV
jgi:tetratricopeptide (TPR) repeat protein